MRNALMSLLLLAMLFICTKNFAQKKYALLVGINNYYAMPGVLHRTVLRGCVNDAMSIKGMLIQRFGFDAANIQVLTDEQASKNNVLQALNNALTKTKKGDAFVFYFSGHGVWMSNTAQNVLDKDVKKGMNQAMVMSDLYADKLDCLFPDIMVKRIFNQFVDKKVIATGIFDCCFSGKIAMMIDEFRKNPYEYMNPQLEERSLSFDDVYDIYYQNCMNHQDSCNTDSLNNTLRLQIAEPTAERSFNMRDNIVISDSRHIIPPSERPNSMFLSVSGADEYQKGVEIKDEKGVYHGAFTKALLQTIYSNPSNTGFITIFNDVIKLMQKKGYAQSPMHFQDPQRLKKNFIGMDPVNFKNSVTGLCKSILNNDVILNIGLNDGLAVGNILSLNGNQKGVQIQVIAVQANEARAKVIRGNQSSIKKGNLFIVTDAHVISPAVMSVYISTQNIAPAAFDQFFNNQIMPLIKADNYWDYQNWYKYQPSSNIFLNNEHYQANPLIKKYTQGIIKDNFLVFLPIPTTVVQTAKALLLRDQNIKMVNSPEKADYVLYLNYVKGEEPGFVFTWYRYFTDATNEGGLQFLPYYTKVAKLQFDNAFQRKLGKDIHEMTLTLAQKKSGQWLNDNLAR